MQSKKIRPSHITDAAARSGGNVAAATELASSTEAVASCQQGVEAKTRHLHKHCTEDHDDNQEYDDDDVSGKLPRRQGARGRATFFQDDHHLGHKCKCRRLRRKSSGGEDWKACCTDL